MNLKHAILHIYDINNDNFLFSQGEISLGDAFFTNYIEKVNGKMQASDCRYGTLEDEEWLKYLAEASEAFIDVTTRIAESIFGVMKDNSGIPKGDLLFYLYEDEESLNHYLGLIKLNFSNETTHNVAYENDQMVNQLIMNHNILPSFSQKIDEGILICLETKEYALVEKACKLEEEGRCYYFSEKILKVPVKKNVAENIREIKKVVEKISDRYQQDTFETKAATQKAVVESIGRFGGIDNSFIAEQLFPENIAAKEEYTEKIIEKEIAPVIEVNNAGRYEKKYSKQRFKLDNGIELSIPLDVYSNRDMVEFINNPDGTISVIIKNIDSIDSRFS